MLSTSILHEAYFRPTKFTTEYYIVAVEFLWFSKVNLQPGMKGLIILWNHWELMIWYERKKTSVITSWLVLFLCQIGWIAVGGTIFSTIHGEKWSKAMHSPTTWDT